MRPKKYLTRDFVVYQDPKYKLKNDVPYKEAIKEREIENYLTRREDNFGEVDPEKGWQRFPDYLDAMDENEKNEKNNSTERTSLERLGSDSETDNKK